MDYYIHEGDICFWYCCFLFACQLDKRKTIGPFFFKAQYKDVAWAKQDPIKFWSNSESQGGYTRLFFTSVNIVRWSIWPWQNKCNTSHTQMVVKFSSDIANCRNAMALYCNPHSMVQVILWDSHTESSCYGALEVVS